MDELEGLLAAARLALGPALAARPVLAEVRAVVLLPPRAEAGVVGGDLAVGCVCVWVGGWVSWLVGLVRRCPYVYVHSSPRSHDMVKMWKSKHTGERKRESTHS